MSAILHRSLSGSPASISKAQGVWITDNSGKIYLDALSGGVAVSCLGYGNERVNSAIAAQLKESAYFHTSFFTSDAAELLAQELTSIAPGELNYVVYSSGGSEAVETALKLARQYWVEKGESSRRFVISRNQSYHGGTLGTLAVGGNKTRREIYAPMLFEAHFISPCFYYRQAEQGESESDYGVRAAAELEKKILELGAENVSTFICEPIVGATLGCVPAAEGYLKEIRRICDAYGVILIFDEIMCGAGRTGRYFACEHDEVVPDILTIAKGLGGGFQPIGATLVSEKIYEALKAGSGLLKHGFTYMGHSVSCAAALEVFRIIKEDELLPQVSLRGEQLFSELKREVGGHPNVGDIRGRGLFVGVELVQDKSTKQPFSPGEKINSKLKNVAFANGLLIYPNGGTVDGISGDHVLFSPAYTVSPGEVSEVVSRFKACLNEVLG